MCYFYNITQECDKPGHNVNFIIPGGDEGIISLCFIAWQNLRIRANRRTPVRLFAAVRTLAPGFESILSNTIKNHARWACFLLWWRRRIPSHGTACRLWGNRNDLTALYLSNLLVVEPAICDCDGFAPFHFTGNNKKCPARAFLLFLAVQGIFYLWLMKDLRPRHKRNGQKQGKAGNFCKKRSF